MDYAMNNVYIIVCDNMSPVYRFLLLYLNSVIFWPFRSKYDIIFKFMNNFITLFIIKQYFNLEQAQANEYEYD